MCNPAMAAGGLMSAASMAANMIGKGEQDAARDSAIGAENVRQQQIQQKSRDLFNATLPQAGAEAQTAANAEHSATRTAKDSATLDANPGIYGTAGASLDGESKSSIARALNGALTRGKQQAKLNADVNGVGDTTSRLGVTLGRAGQWQNIFGTNARASAALLPGELETANQQGSTARGIGQVLGAAGQAAGTAGLMGGGGSWQELFGGGQNLSGFAKGAGPMGPSGGAMASQSWFG